MSDELSDYHRRMREQLGWSLGASYQIQVAWLAGVHACAVCGQACEGEVDDHTGCDNCGWESNSMQEDEPDYRGGANDVSLSDARENYQRTGMSAPHRKMDRLRALIDAGQIQPAYVGVCSVCGEGLPGYLPAFEACARCGWVDAPWYEAQPDEFTNWMNGKITLNSARDKYRRFGCWQAGWEGHEPGGAG